MDFTYVRHRVNLRWAKTGVAAALLFLSALPAQAQYSYKRKHLEFYDDKPVHYGFFFGLPRTRYNVTYSDAFATQDSASRLYSPNNIAFRVGFIANLVLDDRWDLRTSPAISLYTRQVKADYPNGTTLTRDRESSWIELPVHLKYKSLRRQNTRLYLLGGATFGFETNVRRREAPGSQRLNTRTADITLDYGVGFEQFFEFFKFSPELRFSHGLINLLPPGTNPSNPGLGRLTSHTVTLYLNFE